MTPEWQALFLFLGLFLFILEGVLSALLVAHPRFNAIAWGLAAWIAVPFYAALKAI